MEPEPHKSRVVIFKDTQDGNKGGKDAAAFITAVELLMAVSLACFQHSINLITWCIALSQKF